MHGERTTSGIGYSTLGSNEPHTTWFFAEGSTEPGIDQFLVILNPNLSAALVCITYYFGQGSPLTRHLIVAAQARTRVAVHDADHGVGRNQAVSAKVESTNGVGIVVERSIHVHQCSRPAESPVAATATADNDLVPPQELIFVGGGDFKAVGQWFIDWFVEHCSLQPNDRVLDIGCGVGRMAVPLTKYLSPEGRYEGFDIVPKGIEWCQRHITPRFPNFRFRLADIYNSHYTPTATLRASEYVFPYADGWFDLAFLTSVFTHMLPDDVEHYLAEIARVLRPGGSCCATFFLLNDVSMALIEAQKSSLRFHHRIGDCLTTDPARPEDSVAFPENMVRDLFQVAGLEIIDPIRHGHWSGRDDGLTYQDIVLAIKKA